MVSKLNTRIHPQVLESDEDVHRAVRAMPDYKPSNPAYSLDAMDAKQESMHVAMDKEFHVQNELGAARDGAVTEQWEYHELMLGVKEQVVAQYGSNSDQVAALGLKKKAERKAPTRNTPDKSST